MSFRNDVSFKLVRNYKNMQFIFQSLFLTSFYSFKNFVDTCKLRQIIFHACMEESILDHPFAYEGHTWNVKKVLKAFIGLKATY